MFKIKKHIDLKTLEAFSFEESSFEPLLVRKVIDLNYDLKCYVDKSTREIWISEKGKTFCGGKK